MNGLHHKFKTIEDESNELGDKTEVIADINEFYTRVHTISNDEELRFLGFNVDSVVGTFHEEDLADLKQFCKDNPEFHIVTQTHPGRHVNRLIEKSDHYTLADGDANPNLILNPFAGENPELVMEDLFSKAFTEFRKIYRGDK